jgi:hypothetical protein
LMPGRDTPRSRDPDDWFDDLDAADTRRERPVERPGAPSARLQSIPVSFSDRRVAIAAGVVIAACLVVGGLAVAGVFSGSKPTPPVTTTQFTSTETSTASTTTARVPTVTAPTTTLKPGDTGAQVRALQRALAQLGYPVGKIDGDYGTATKTALERFQTAGKLTADGLFGPATRAALVTALKAR